MTDGNDLPYDEDGFARVDWRHRGRYMQARHGIEPGVAGEAVSDPDRVVFSPDYNSLTGRSVRIIGFSVSLQRLVSVIVLKQGDRVYGVNGWVSNERDRRLYEEAQR